MMFLIGCAWMPSGAANSPCASVNRDPSVGPPRPPASGEMGRGACILSHDQKPTTSSGPGKSVSLAVTVTTEPPVVCPTHYGPLSGRRNLASAVALVPARDVGPTRLECRAPTEQNVHRLAHQPQAILQCCLRRFDPVDLLRTADPPEHRVVVRAQEFEPLLHPRLDTG